MAVHKKKQKRNKRFLMELYQEYRRLMCQIASELTDDVELRNDIIQMALVKLDKKEDLLQTLKKESIPYYIDYAIRSAAYSRLNQKNDCEDQTVETEDGDFTTEDPMLTSIGGTLSEEICRGLNPVWQTLSEYEKLLVEGKYLFDENEEDLALALGQKPEQVRTALTRARRNVIESLKVVEE